MVAVKIDGTPGEADLSRGTTLAAVFEATREALRLRDRVVVQVLLNGHEIVWQDGNPAWGETLTDADQLELATDTPTRLSRGLLTRVHSRAADLAERHRELATVLRTSVGGMRDLLASRRPDAETLVEMINWWQEVQQTFAFICQMFDANLADPQSSPMAAVVVPAARRLAEQLRQLEEAMGLDDFVLVADLLEYEFAPACDDWRQVAAQVQAILPPDRDLEA